MQAACAWNVSNELLSSLSPKQTPFMNVFPCLGGIHRSGDNNKIWHLYGAFSFQSASL